MNSNNINKENLPINDDWLNRLMEGKLSEEEERQLLSNMDDNEMVADTVEGLAQFESMQKARKQVNEINRKLSLQLKTKTNKANPFNISINTIIWIGLIFIILLALVAHYLIRIKGF